MAKKPKTVEAPVIETPVVAETPATPKTRGPRGVSDGAIVTVLVENPKRGGSKAHSIFSCYATGLSVADIFAAAKEAGFDEAYVTPCLVWDAKHGFITIEGYDPGAIVERKVREPKAPKAPKAKKAKAEAPADAEVEAAAVEEAMV